MTKTTMMVQWWYDDDDDDDDDDDAVDDHDDHDHDHNDDDVYETLFRDLNPLDLVLEDTPLALSPIQVNSFHRIIHCLPHWGILNPDQFSSCWVVNKLQTIALGYL